MEIDSVGREDTQSPQPMQRSLLTKAESAGEIKASRKMSLADCFSAAPAKQRNGEIYTEGPEFKALEPEWKIVYL
jgi:predicted nucleic acid-binding protein